MSKYAARSLIFLLFLWGCSTSPTDVADTTSQVSLIDESRVIDESLTQIVLSTPASLSQAMDGLLNSDVGESEQAREFFFVARELFFMLYPLLEPPESSLLPPVSSSSFPGLFEEIQNGVLPTVPADETSFLVLLLTPLASLFSEDPEIFDASFEYINQAAALNTQSVLPYYINGWILEQKESFQDASNSYEQALSIGAGCYPARLGKARTEIQLGDYAEAKKHLQVLAKELPNNAGILGLTARVAFLQGDYESAGSLSAQAISLDSDDMEMLFLRAQILEAGENNVQADRILRIVESQTPNKKMVLTLRIKLLSKTGADSDILAVLVRAVELYPEDRDFKTQYGKLLIKTGNAEEGRGILTQTLDSDPNSLVSLAALFEDAKTRQDWREAEQYVSRILIQNTSDFWLREAVVVLNKVEDFEGAANHAAELYQRDTTNIESVLLYAEILAELSDSQVLRSIVEPVVDTAESTGQRSRLLYYLSLAIEEPQQRVAVLLESLFSDMQNMESLIAISFAYEEIEDIRSAFRWLNQAAKLLPEDEELQERLRDLEERLRS